MEGERLYAEKSSLEAEEENVNFDDQVAEIIVCVHRTDERREREGANEGVINE